MLAGTFVIAAAWMNIVYDRRKTEKKDAYSRRKSIENVFKAVEHILRLIFSTHSHITNSSNFPSGVQEAFQVDVEFYERVVLQHLDVLPRNVANRCMFVAFGIRLHNKKIQHLVEVPRDELPSDFANVFSFKLEFFRTLEGLMLCCDLIMLQLRALGSVDEIIVDSRVFDFIDMTTLAHIMANRQVPPSRVDDYLRDLEIQAVPSDLRPPWFR